MRNAFVRRTSRLFLGCTLVAAGALPALATAWQPDKNVEIVVAGGPGGGTDQLGRLIQSIITTHKFLDVNTIVLNKGGGNGAEAFLDMKMNKGDAEKLVIGTNNIYLLPLVSKLGYQWQELTPIAAVAEDDFILWSYKDAPWKDAKGFYEAVKADPSNLRMGGSQSKDVDQTLTLLLNQTTNSKLVYIPFKSGSEAATQLAGKHIAANVNNPSESISQWRGDQVEPLCVFSKERMSLHRESRRRQILGRRSDLPRTRPGHRSIPLPTHRVHARRSHRRTTRVLCRADAQSHRDPGVQGLRQAERAGADLPRRRAADRLH